MSFQSEDPLLKRDPTSSALLNMDMDEYQRHIKEREAFIKMRDLANQVQTLNTDITDIKQILQQLLNGKLNG